MSDGRSQARESERHAGRVLVLRMTTALALQGEKEADGEMRTTAILVTGTFKSWVIVTQSYGTSRGLELNKVLGTDFRGCFLLFSFLLSLSLSLIISFACI